MPYTTPCPVCRRPRRQPIFTCSKGHVLCTSCRRDLTVCQTCGIPLGHHLEGRNRAALTKMIIQEEHRLDAERYNEVVSIASGRYRYLDEGTLSKINQQSIDRLLVYLIDIQPMSYAVESKKDNISRVITEFEDYLKENDFLSVGWHGQTSGTTAPMKLRCGSSITHMVRFSKGEYFLFKCNMNLKKKPGSVIVTVDYQHFESKDISIEVIFKNRKPIQELHRPLISCRRLDLIPNIQQNSEEQRIESKKVLLPSDLLQPYLIAGKYFVVSLNIT